MKKEQQGFVGLAIAIIVGIVLIGRGAYIYLNKVHEQNGDNLSTTNLITDLKDVKDFDTCVNYTKNIQIRFDMVFTHGSDFQQVRKFADDFKAKYSRATLEKVSSETDFINYNIEINKSGIYTESQKTDYKKMLAELAYPAISIRVPIIDLGTKESFNDFISKTLQNYPLITFRQYSGSNPDVSLDRKMPQISQQSAEKQCAKYKQMNESDRSALEIKNQDDQIKMSIISVRYYASMYFDEHNSYAPGILSLNSGVCSDEGTNGLKNKIEHTKEIAGSAYCYASSDAYAVSAPLKSNPATGYCADSTGFSGIVSSPTAASKGYCNLPPPEKKTDISSCQNGADARARWICVGNIVSTRAIENMVEPYARPNADKIAFCKTLSGIEADYCFASIVKSESVAGFTQEGASICNMVSNKNPWFKNDCTTD